MPRMHDEHLADRSRVARRRNKRDRVRLKTSLLPEMECLEVRITPTVRTWSGAVDNIWTNPANWDSLPSPGDDLVFPSDATRLISVDDFAAGTSFGSITIGSAGYSILGNPLSLTNGITTTYNSGTSIFKNDTELGSGLLAVTPAGTLELEGTLTGSAGLTISGGGAVKFSGLSANTYSGVTTLNAGTLILSKTGVISVPGNLVVGDGAGSDVVQLLSPDQIEDTASVNVKGSGLLDLNGNDDTIDSLTLAGSSVTTGAGTLTLDGDLTTIDSATLATVTGKLALSAGSHSFTIGAPSVDVAPDLTISAIISGSGGIAKTGLGTLRLTGANQYQGLTTISQGLVSIGSNTALGDATAGTVVEDGAQLDLAGGLTITGEDLTISGSGLVADGALHSISGTNAISGTFTLGGDSVIGVESGSLSLTGGIGDGGNTYGVTKLGGGVLIFDGAVSNTYTGTTTVNQGTLRLSHTAAGPIAVAGALVIGDGSEPVTVEEGQDDQIADTSTITIEAGSTLDLGGHNDTVGSISMTAATIATGAGTLTLGGDVTTVGAADPSLITGHLDLGGADRTFSVGSGSADSDLTISASISGTGAGLLKTGATSTLTLSGSNTYDGATTISGGTIVITAADALGTSISGTTVANGATLALKDTLTTISEPLTITGAGVGGSGAINNISGDNVIAASIFFNGPSTINVADGTTLTDYGQITDGVNTYDLTKIGTGTLAMGNANPYDGTVIITEGTIRASNGYALGTGDVVVQDGAGLEVLGDITFSSNSITLTGTGFDGNGALRSLSGNNSVASSLTIDSATARIQVDSGQLTLSGNIGEGGSGLGVEKSGPGLLILSGTSSTTEGIRVFTGELQVTGSVDSGKVQLNGSTLSGTGTINSIQVDQGTLSPGLTADTGILTASTGLLLSYQATVQIGIAGTTAGTGYDQVVNTTSGSVDLADSVLNVSLLNGFIPAVGDTFTIIDKQNAGAITGTFKNLAEGVTFQSGIVTFSISYVGGNGNDVVLTVDSVTYTWSGGGADALWTTGDNWIGGSAPSAGSNLVFPATASRLSNTNDFAAHTNFNNITIEAPGYNISGNRIDLAGTISATLILGTSEFQLDTDLTSTKTISVATGGKLILSGAIAGTGYGLTKADGGTLQLAGSTPNSYDGTTIVLGGTLELNKSNSGFDSKSIVGNLVIGDNTGTNAQVVLLTEDQIADSATVTVEEGATLDLNDRAERILSLAMQGSTVLTSGTNGVLLIDSSIVIQSSTLDLISSIQGPGKLDFGGNTVFVIDVSDTASLDVDARISAIVQGGGIVKLGSGVLALSGDNSYNDTTMVNAGAIQVESSHALGSNVSDTVVLSGAAIYFDGSSLDVLDAFDVVGTGLNGSNVLAVRSGTTTLLSAVTMSGDIHIGAASGSTLNLHGAIDDGVDDYSIFVDNGTTGRTILSTSNGFDGDVTVSLGYFQIAESGALGNPATVSTLLVQSGASLEIVGNSAVPATKHVILSESPVSGAAKLIAISGNNTFGGPSGSFQFDASQTIEVPDGTDLSINSPIDDNSGSFDLTKIGHGSLHLGATSADFTGSIIVSEGILDLIGDLSSTPGSIQVGADGTLIGSGKAPEVSVENGGLVKPGNPIGILQTADINFSNGSGLSIELDGETVGTQYDQLDVNGIVTLNNPTLAINFGGSYVPSIGTVFTIINNDGVDGVVGTFNGLAEGSTITVGVITFEVSYLGVGGTGNDVILTVTNVAYTWDGGGADNNWSTAENWLTDQVPTEGSNLIFPDSASRLSSTNDLTAYLRFGSITIAAAGYNLVGNAIDLDGSIVASYGAGTSEIGFSINLVANLTIDVAAGGSFFHNSGITGVGFGVTKLGGGTLTFGGGLNANTYTGTTLVDDGLLILFKDYSVVAIGGNLVIGDDLGSDSVRLDSNGQIPDSATVSLGQGASLDLNGHSDTIAILNLKGATVLTGFGGSLGVTTGIFSTLTSNSSLSTIGGPGSLNLSGSVALPIQVDADPSLATNLRISAEITNGGIWKTGTGILALSGNNTYWDNTLVSNGAIQVESIQALGQGLGATIVASGASLYFSGFNLSTNEMILISGAGLNGTGALYVIDGQTRIQGSLVLNGNSQIGAGAGSTLTINGSIDSNGDPFLLTITNDPQGRTILDGDNSTFLGNVTLTSGILRGASDNAFGAPGTASQVTSGNGTLIELAGGITIPATKTINLVGVTIPGTSKLMNLSGDNTVLGDITLLNNNESTDVASGSTLILAGTISGSVSLDKNGPGTLVLAGTNTHTGNMNVGEGTLLVNGSIGASQNVLVDGTVGGTGTVSNLLISPIGRVAPGEWTGVLTANDVSLATGSIFSVEIEGSVVGTGYDQLVATGDKVTLDSDQSGGAILSISLGFSPATGDTFVILKKQGAGPIEGTFNGLPEGSTIKIGNQSFLLSYVGGDGNDVALTALQRVDTWTGLGGDANWSTAANWASGIAPIAGDQLVFPLGAPRANNQNDFVPGTTFDSIIIAGAGYSLSGNAIQLQDGIQTTFAIGTSSIGLDITLLANQSIDVDAAGILAISGKIDGAFSLTKLGDGTLTLSAGNTYVGNTNIVEGTVFASGSAAKLGQGTLVITAGASLELNGGVTLANNATVGGSGVSNSGAIWSGASGPNTVQGNITLTSGTLFSSSNQLRLSGAIGGAFGITTQGLGTISLEGAAPNTYTGLTTQQSAWLTVAKSPNVIAIPGGLRVETGTFLVQANEQIADSAAVELAASDVVFDLDGSDETIDSLVFNGGTVATGAGTLFLSNGGGGITSNASSTKATITGHLNLNGAPSITVAQGSDPSGVDLEISAIVGAINSALIKFGPGTLALSGANTYTGGTLVGGGILAINNSSALGTGHVTVQTELDITGDLSLTNDMTLDSIGTAIVNQSGTTTLLGSIDLVHNTTLSIASASTLSFVGTISDGGNSHQLSKTGAGLLQLSGANTYSGGTQVIAGTLEVGLAQSTGTAGIVEMGLGTTLLLSTASYTLPSGGLELGIGTSIVVDSATSQTMTGDVALIGDGTFDIDDSLGSLTVNGVISGAASLGKVGAGRLILPLTSTYSGSTTVSAGTLQVDGDITSSTGVTIANLATLQGNGSVAAVWIDSGGQISPGNSTGILNTGDLHLFTGATLNIEGNGTVNGVGYDQVNVIGEVSLQGSTLSATLGFTPSPGDFLTIIDNDGVDSVDGTFDGLAEGAELVIGGYSFTISYVGGTGNDVVLTCFATTTTTVSALPATSVFGESVTFRAVVSANIGTPTGTVVFKDGGVALPGGTVTLSTVLGQQVATYTTSTLAVGNHTITVDYNGATFFRTSSGSLPGNPYLVSPANTTTLVSSSDASVTYGDSLSFTALVTIDSPGAGPLSGTVTFKDGSTTLGTGTLNSLGIATYYTTSLGASGTPHVITAYYTPGDNTTNPSDSELTPYDQTVNQAALLISANDLSRVYGDANPTLTVTFTGFVNGETLATSDVTGAPSVTTSATPTSPVVGSPYSILAGLGTLVSGNYSFSFANGELEVTPATLTVKADDQSRAYGDANPTLTATFTGFKNGETLATSDVTGTPSITTPATPTSPVNASPYAIFAGAGSLASSNYTFAYVDGLLELTKATLSVTANDLARIYGDANPTLTATFSGFKNGETLATSDVTGSVSLSTLAIATSPVSGSPYTITAALGTLVSGNYSFSLHDGVLVVNKAMLNVTANDRSRIYGDANPNFTASYSGFKNGETLATSGVTGAPSLNTSASPTSPVNGSPYSIQTGLGSLTSGNYDFFLLDGVLQVTPATLAVKADDQSRIYGDTNPTLTVSFSGFKNGETLATSDVTGSPSVNTLATPTSPVNVSPYAILVGEGSLGSSNYIFDYVDGLLQLTKATLSVTADDLGRIYGDANPTLTATFSGFKNGETLATSDVTGSVSLSTLALATSPVNGSPYTITTSLGTLSSGNYSFSLINGNLGVNQATLDVIANDRSRVYGDANPTFTASYSGFKNGETLATSDVSGSPSLTTPATLSSPVNGGPYTIFSGPGTLNSGNYAFHYVNGELELTKAPLTVSADDQSRDYGAANPTFTASYSGFKNGETLATSDLTGTPSLTTSATPTSPVSGSPYLIIAAQGTLDSGNYSLSFEDGELTVFKSSSQTNLSSTISPSVFGQPVTFTATVSPTDQGQPTGTVTFWNNGQSLGSAVLNGSGVATLTTSSLDTGLHSIWFTYSGDSNFNPALSPELEQTVSQAATASVLSSSVPVAVFGQSVTFTATVSPVAPGAGVPTGTVIFFDNVTLIGIALLDGAGIAHLTTSGLSVGLHNMSIVYSGDAQFQGSASSTPQTVDRASVSGSVVSTVNPAAFGQGYQFGATFIAVSPGAGTPNGGSVSFFDGSTQIGTGTLVNGQASINAPILPVGLHQISAVYEGNSDFRSGTSTTLVQAVNTASVAVDLQTSGTTVFGQSVTFSVTVTPEFAGVPTGLVLFLDGSNVIGQATLNGAGSATFTTSAISVGSHLIAAQYQGSAQYQGGVDSLTQVVDLASTTTSLQSSSSNSTFGQAVTLTTQVLVVSPGSGLPTGLVQFWDGATSIGSSPIGAGGSATLTVPLFSVGTHSITATYGGDGSFLASTSTSISQVVSRGTASMAIASSAIGGVVFGQSVQFAATLTGAAVPAGTVSFFDGQTLIGTSSLVGGTASISTSALSVGSHAISYHYQGDVNFEPGDSPTLNQLVNRASLTAALVSSVASPVSGQSITFTTTLSPAAPGAGTPTGTVIYWNGSTFIGQAPLVAGQAQFTTSSLSVGNHNITATYSGDNNFNSAQAARSETVAKAISISIVTSSAPTAVFGQTVTYVVSVYPYAPGVGTPTGTVNFFDGSTLIGTGTLAFGQATLTVSASGAGSTHSITASYAGDSNFLSNTSAVFNQVVNKADTQTYLAITPTTQNRVAGYLISFGVATLTPGNGIPTGSVVLYAQGLPYKTLTLVNGLASTFVSKATANKLGGHFAGRYLGDSGHNASVSPIVGLKGSPIVAAARPMKAFRKR